MAKKRKVTAAQAQVAATAGQTVTLVEGMVEEARTRIRVNSEEAACVRYGSGGASVAPSVRSVQAAARRRRAS